MYGNPRGTKVNWDQIDTPIYHLGLDQVDFLFSFVPLEEQLMPSPDFSISNFSGSPLQVHDIAKSTGKPNFFEAKIPIKPQLNVKVWEEALF